MDAQAFRCRDGLVVEGVLVALLLVLLVFGLLAGILAVAVCRRALLASGFLVAFLLVGLGLGFHLRALDGGLRGLHHLAARGLQVEVLGDEGLGLCPYLYR